MVPYWQTQRVPKEKEKERNRESGKCHRDSQSKFSEDNEDLFAA